jgi:hypothetical protein
MRGHSSVTSSIYRVIYIVAEMPAKKKSDNGVEQPKTKKAKTTMDPPPSTVSVPVESNTATSKYKKKAAADPAVVKKARPSKLVVSQTIPTPSTSPNAISNVILHLKCTSHDLSEYNYRLHSIMSTPLDYDPSVPPDVQSYESLSSTSLLASTTLLMDDMDEPSPSSENFSTENIYSAVELTASSTALATATSALPTTKELDRQLKSLRFQLYKNALRGGASSNDKIDDNNACCFWDTCDFDGIPYRIPLYELNGTIYGYGCFCRPQCAVAFLFKENLDDSTKFERYALLNQMYGDLSTPKKGNICPAPDPYYTLEKFYGNLSIKQYRELFHTNHMLITVNKPLTRVLPELHEETDDTVLNAYGIQKTMGANAATGSYRVKRQSEKQAGPSKASILRESFGLR